MELEEKNEVKISGKGILIATKAGTRKYENGRLVEPGEIVATVETPNIICNEGLLLVAGFAIDESATYDTGITYCEIGTDSTAPAAHRFPPSEHYHLRVSCFICGHIFNILHRR